MCYFKLSCIAEMLITQADDHVKLILTFQLINVISRVLKKLLKCFKVTIISASFVLVSLAVFPVIFFDLNDSESAKLSTLVLLCQCLWHFLFLYYLFHF